MLANRVNKGYLWQVCRLANRVNKGDQRRFDVMTRVPV